MTFDELPTQYRRQIMRSCINQGITSPEDMRTAYDNFVEGRNIFDGLSESYQRASAFGRFLANGGHIYDGETESTNLLERAGNRRYETMPTGHIDSLTFRGNNPQEAYLGNERLTVKDMGDYYAYSNGQHVWSVPKNKFEDNSNLNAQQRLERDWRSSPAYGFDKVMFGTLAGSVAPFAAYQAGPTMLGWANAASDAAMATKAGQVIGTGVTVAMPYIQAGMDSYFGAHGLHDIANRNANAMTALELMPLTRVAKPMYQATKEMSGPLVDAVSNNVGLGRNAAGDWNGWIRLGNREYRPAVSSLGVGAPIESRPIGNGEAAQNLTINGLLHKLQRGKISEAELSKYVTQKEAKWLLKNVMTREYAKQNAILEKAVKGMKGKRGANDDIIKAEKEYNVGTPKERLKAIRDNYLSEIERAKEETGIDWSDQSSVMASMPDKLKLSPVGKDKITPFLERYYKNVMKVIGKNGIQNKLLKNGELRQNINGQWEGKFDDGYRLVEPTEYIKMRIANEKGLHLDLAARKPGASNYPMHGTKKKSYHYLTMPSSHPGKRGYWTGIQDDAEGSSGALDYYKGKGALVPFFRMPEYELPMMKPNGISSSNSYGGTGESLMDMLLKKPGKIQVPTFVSDPSTGGIPFNEYNFGPNVPNPKAMWNTLDFEPGAGPLAYNYDSSSNSNYT